MSDATPTATTAPTPQLPLSVVTIGHKDDAPYFPAMLASLPKGCELIVLWNESKDGTQGEQGYSEPVLFKESEIMGISIKQYEMTFEDGRFDFSTARNIAARFASREWILWLDMDSRIMAHQHRWFSETLPTYPAGVGGLIGGEVGCQPSLVEEMDFTRFHVAQVRLYRNYHGFYFRGLIHEQVIYSIREAGYQCIPCSVIIHHVGYETTLERIKEKTARNVGLLVEQVSKTETNQHEYLEMLHRDLDLYLSLHKKGIT